MGAIPSLLNAALAATTPFSPEETQALLQEPIIIVSAPRSGSNLLFELMSRIPGFWNIGGESHAVFGAFPHLRAENAALDSGRLDRSHADAATCHGVRACFLFLVKDHRGIPYLRLAPAERPRSIRLLEKTPRNALNIPFLLEVFPDARFIFLHRDARENVAIHRSVEGGAGERPLRYVSGSAGLEQAGVVLPPAARLALHDWQAAGGHCCVSVDVEQ